MTGDAPSSPSADEARTPVGHRLIPVAHIHPNPNQPRLRLGRIEALANSIREQGLLNPILVRRLGPRDYQIIAGERRFAAARRAGLSEVVCVERTADEAQTLELALVENLLRTDLDAFEEAAGYEALIREHGYTHESLGRRMGKARSSITEALSLLRIPEAVRALCAEAELRSRRQLLKVARAGDPEAMASVAQRLRRGLEPELESAPAPEGGGPGREGRARAGSSRARPFVFRYSPRGGPFRLRMTFRRSAVEDREVLEALRDLVRQLEASASERAGTDDAP